MGKESAKGEKSQKPRSDEPGTEGERLIILWGCRFDKNWIENKKKK